MRHSLSLFAATAVSLLAFAGCTQSRASGCRLGARPDGGALLVCEDPTTGKAREIDPAAPDLNACVFLGIENGRATLLCGEQFVSVADGRDGDAGAPGKDGTSCVYVGNWLDTHEIECCDKRFTLKDGAKGEQGKQGNPGSPGTNGRNGVDGQSDYTTTLEDAQMSPAQPSMLDKKIGCHAKLTTTDRDITSRSLVSELFVNGVSRTRSSAREFDFDRVRYSFSLYSEDFAPGDKLQCRITAYAGGQPGAPVGVVSTAQSAEIVLQGSALPRLRASMLGATVATEVVNGKTLVRFALAAPAEFSREFGTSCSVSATYWLATSNTPEPRSGSVDFANASSVTFPSAGLEPPPSPTSAHLSARCVGERNETYLTSYTAP
jgi:hypothetical protein